MKKNECVIGLDFTEDDEFCKGCALAKVPKSTFKLSKNTHSSKPGDLFTMDLCSSSLSVSLSNSKYYLLLKDDFSKYKLIYFLKSKAEVPYFIRQFVAEVKRDISNTPVTIRTDNAKEFLSKEVKNFLNKAGIILELSSPYCPQQISSVEREHRTLIEDARALLQSSSLYDTLWAEAVNTCCFTRNLIVPSGHDVTPFEARHKRKPDVSNIRIFGSECYCVLPNRKRIKIGPKSQKGILVGYEWRTKAFRVYYPERKIVAIEKHVVINEETRKIIDQQSKDQMHTQAEFLIHSSENQKNNLNLNLNPIV